MDRKFIYRYVITLLMLACVFGGKAQLTLTLERTITLAADSSLNAFRYKNMYLAGYWEYRTYKAGRLPSLTLNLTPAQYRRYFTQRYDSEADIDVYRKQQSFYAGGQLEIEQNFDLLGGTFYWIQTWIICAISATKLITSSHRFRSASATSKTYWGITLLNGNGKSNR